MRNLRRQDLLGSQTPLAVMFGQLSAVFAMALLFCCGAAFGQAQSDAQPAAETAAPPSISELVLASALTRADAVLPDRRSFSSNAPQWKPFIAALDAPPRPLPRLERLFKEPGFFDAGSNQ